MAKIKQKIKPGRGYAWAIQYTDGTFNLCNWAEPLKASPTNPFYSSKPSPEAKRLHVAIVPMTEWKRLTRKKK